VALRSPCPWSHPVRRAARPPTVSHVRRLGGERFCSALGTFALSKKFAPAFDRAFHRPRLWRTVAEHVLLQGVKPPAASSPPWYFRSAPAPRYHRRTPPVPLPAFSVALGRPGNDPVHRVAVEVDQIPLRCRASIMVDELAGSPQGANRSTPAPGHRWRTGRTVPSWWRILVGPHPETGEAPPPVRSALVHFACGAGRYFRSPRPSRRTGRAGATHGGECDPSTYRRPGRPSPCPARTRRPGEMRSVHGSLRAASGPARSRETRTRLNRMNPTLNNGKERIVLTYFIYVPERGGAKVHVPLNSEGKTRDGDVGPEQRARVRRRVDLAALPRAPQR